MTTRLPVGRSLSFASGEFGFNLAWQSIELFLLFYYTDVIGLSPWWAGVVFALGSVWDGVLDPIIGALADRTRTRWGRFRPWVIFGSPLIGLTLAGAFYAPALAPAQLAVYALVSHLALRTAYTASSIPFLSLSSRVTGDAGDRATIAGFRMQFAALGGLCVSLAYPFLTDRFGGARAFSLGAILFGVVLVPVLLNAMRAVEEPAESVSPAPRQPLLAALREDGHAFVRIARHNTAFLQVLGAVVLTSLALTMLTKASLYYFKYYLQAPGLARYSLALGAAKFIVLAPAWAWYANRTSKRHAWMVASSISISGLIPLYFTSPAHPSVAFWLLFYVGIGSAGYAVLFWAMLPDTVEVNEVSFGQRDEAKVFSLALFARKLALAVNALLLGTLLSVAGFVPNRAQTPETLWALKALFTLVPLVGAVLSMVVLWRYRLDATEHNRLRTLLAERLQPGQGMA